MVLVVRLPVDGADAAARRRAVAEPCVLVPGRLVLVDAAGIERVDRPGMVADDANGEVRPPPSFGSGPACSWT
jgi:hypothetical protein